MLALELLVTVALTVASAAEVRTQRVPNQDTADPSCSSGVSGKDYKIEFAKPERDDKPVLVVTKANGKQLYQWAIPAMDSSVACRKLLYFPEQKVLLAEIYEGQNGTAVVNKSRSILVYKLDKDRFTYVATFPLEQTIQKDSDPIQFLVNFTYETKVEKDRVELSIRNELSPQREISKHSF